jgi:ubiquinone/menaquinone biosynthesis C-methylase UbiE
MPSCKIEPICVVCGTALPAPESSTVICPGCGRTSRVVLGIIDLRHPDRMGASEKTKLIEALLARFAASNYVDLVNEYIEDAAPAKRSFQRRVEHNREYKLKQVERGRQFVHMFESAAQKLYGAGLQQACLEIGCGSGAALLELARQFDVVVGLDPDLPSLILARKALAEAGVQNVQLYQGYAQNVPFQPGTFDFVMAQNTLEHVFEVDAAIGEFKRVLAPGGVFVADSRNRFDMLFPEPHTGVRWVGMLPRAWAKKYVRWRTGTVYDHTLLQSYWDLRRALDRHFGRRNYQIRLPSIDAYGYSPTIGSMLSVIDLVPALSLVILQFFPSHLVVGHQPGSHQNAA